MPKIRTARVHGGQVLRLTLASPPGNLLDAELLGELSAALGEAEGDLRLKLILFGASGPDFSAGAGLDVAAAARLSTLLRRLIDLGVPTAAVVHGRCLGPALDLVAFCNFIFGAAAASFGQPGVVRGAGLFPTPLSIILPLKLGAERAGDVVLGGVTVDGVEAYRRGLVTAWAPTADLDALATAWIQNHVLPRSAVSLRRANRVARLGFHARLAAELPALERFYARQAGASAICLAPERASA